MNVQVIDDEWWRYRLEPGKQSDQSLIRTAEHITQADPAIAPKGFRRKKTRTFIVGWLNRHADEQHAVAPQAAAQQGVDNVVPLKTPAQIAIMRAAKYS